MRSEDLTTDSHLSLNSLNLEAELDFRHPWIIQFSMFYLLHICKHTGGKRNRRWRESGKGEGGKEGETERGMRKYVQKVSLKRPIYNKAGKNSKRDTDKITVGHRTD